MIARPEWTGPGVFVLPSRLEGIFSGHRLTLERDDAIITATLRKLGLWPKVKDEVRFGRSWLLAYPSETALDVFVWLGKPGDSGFLHYHLEGVTPMTPACFQLLASLRGMVKKIDRTEYYELGDLRVSMGGGC